MTSNSHYTLSIIIPVYNSAEFIVETLESVYKNIAEDVEVIIINDGSTDNTEEKIQSFLLTHDVHQTQFISQSNMGVSASRNTGLANAKGDYIAFVDSDDIVSPDYHAILLPLVRKNKYDIIEFDLTRDYDKLYRTEQNTTLHDAKEITVTRDKMHTLTPVFEASQWHLMTKIFHRKLICNEQFEVARRYEDMILTPFLYLKSTCNLKIDCALYFYRKNGNSITENLQESDAEHIFYAMMKMCSYVQHHQHARALATLMIVNCFLEGRKIIRKKRGFYDYNDTMLGYFSTVIKHSDKSVIPSKIYFKMKYPKFDKFISKMRYRLLTALKGIFKSGVK
ncbi:glycosyl transferase family 2 [[Pantoea] beijingensis]|uniref:Glycosyl transferase family 2 n=1 Tax=[Pantoea] beijingensis TaxID=1324864 RepID=A0A443IGJ9_9GAMM|nr:MULTISPECIES: glycosyltransferase family 2 protein [Erwiniaceae]RWR03196.1 glycosyl transferase family 2 [[Pantoea] beijingensis]